MTDKPSKLISLSKKLAALGVIIAFLGTLGYNFPKLAMSDDLEVLRVDFYASQCEMLHRDYLRLMEKKEKFKPNIPDWLETLIVKNATDKAKYGCTY